MSGYRTIMQIKRLEKSCEELGLTITPSKFSNRHDDILALKPKDDSLPLFSRDHEIVNGTIDHVESFIAGLAWARLYDSMLFGDKHEKKPAQKRARLEK